MSRASLPAGTRRARSRRRRPAIASYKRGSGSSPSEAHVDHPRAVGRRVADPLGDGARRPGPGASSTLTVMIFACGPRRRRRGRSPRPRWSRRRACRGRCRREVLAGAGVGEVDAVDVVDVAVVVVVDAVAGDLVEVGPDVRARGRGGRAARPGVDDGDDHAGALRELPGAGKVDQSARGDRPLLALTLVVEEPGPASGGHARRSTRVMQAPRSSRRPARTTAGRLDTLTPRCCTRWRRTCGRGEARNHVASHVTDRSAMRPHLSRCWWLAVLAGARAGPDAARRSPRRRRRRCASPRPADGLLTPRACGVGLRAGHTGLRVGSAAFVRADGRRGRSDGPR